MLYNSELWALTSKAQDQIDAFQRKLLRNILQLGWPRKTSNEKLNQITKIEPWSIVIKRRRFRWLGHLLRLPDHTPAKRATKEAFRGTKSKGIFPRKVGRPPLTWIQQICNDVKDINFIDTTEEDENEDIFRKLETLAKDRAGYAKRVNHCIPHERCPQDTMEAVI